MSDKKVDYSEFREEAEEVLDLEEESSEQRRKRGGRSSSARLKSSTSSARNMKRISAPF